MKKKMKNEKIMLKTIKMILFYILPTVQNIFGIGEGLRVDWADVIELQLWIDIISYEMQLLSGPVGKVISDMAYKSFLVFYS